MKKSVKLFGLLMISVVLFSCSTDEQDEDLERAIKLSESMQQTQAREGDGTQEEGTPVIVAKKE